MNQGLNQQQERENDNYKYRFLDPYAIRIKAAVNYKGSDDHEDIVSILKDLYERTTRHEVGEVLDRIAVEQIRLMGGANEVVNVVVREMVRIAGSK